MSLTTLLNKIKEGGNNAAPDSAASSAFKVLGASSTVNATDHSQILLNRNLFIAISDLYHSLDCKYDPLVVRDDSLAILEDVCIGKKVILTKSYQALVIGIYGILIKQAPGYAIRNILLSMINVLNHKLSTPFGKECVLEIISHIMINRINDCASQVSEVFLNLNKLVRANEAIVRISSMRCLLAIVRAEGGKMSDLYVDIAKILPKTIVDRVPEVRRYSAELAENLCLYSDGFSIINADTIQPHLVKALEDENASVQEAVIKAYATIFEVQINSYLEKQEQSKIGAARGGSDTSTPAKSKQPAPSRLSFASKLPSLKKVVVEEHADYKTIIEKIGKTIQISCGATKVSHIFVMGHVISNCLDKISLEEFEWTIQHYFSMLHDEAVQSLTFEEQNFLRVRFSYVFRSFVVAKVNESKQLTIAAELAKFSGGMDASSRNDIEMQLALCEMNHVLTVLGIASCAVADEANMAASTNLRHSSFGVRSAAANILLTISLTSPNAAVEFIHTATQTARKQMKELLSLSGAADDSPINDEAFDDSGETTPTNPARKKTGKELERMQKMFFFHGQTLVLSLIIKNVKSLPCGLPTSVILEVLELGLDMMNHDIKQTPQPLRHVVCSIIRAGGLIISSCLGMGYEHAQLRMTEILMVCQRLVRLGEISPNNTSVRVDDLLFEMMCIEAGLLCLTALLLYSSEALLVENGCLVSVIDNLEFCFKAMKSKYQPNFRNHFRCRTLHITLLETYTLLPPGTYPSSSQQIYMEALRVLRDSISAGLECSPSVMNDLEYSSYSDDLQEMLSHFPLLSHDYVESECSLVLKLETYLQPLQKKESEAFLSVFGKDHHSVALLTKCVGFGSCYGYVDERSAKIAIHGDRISSQSCQIESRTLDAALKLLGVTFSHQSPEYQDKAVQLFSQAISQLNQSNQSSSSRMSLSTTAKGMGLFSNDEERRKREKRNCITLRSVICAFKSIVQNFPVHIGGDINTDEIDYAWRQSIIDHVFDLLTNNDVSIRRAAASTMALFSKKWRGTNIIASVCSRMRSAIVSTLEKKVDANVINDYVGFISTLGYLWIHCTESAETRSLISTTLFDSLRKSDSSMIFQAHVFVSLSMICIAQLDQVSHTLKVSPLIREDTEDFIDKILYVAGVSSSNVLNANYEEYPIFIESLVRLTNACLALGLAVNISELTLNRVRNQWKLSQIMAAGGSYTVLSEAKYCTFVQANLTGLSIIAKFDTQQLFTCDLMEFVKGYFTNINLLTTCSSYSLIVLTDILEIFVRNALHDEMKTLSWLFSIFEVAFQKLGECTLLAQPNVEAKHPLVGIQNVYQNISKCFDKLYSIFILIVNQDLANGNIHNKLAFWTIYCRSLAMGLNSNLYQGSSNDDIGEKQGGGRDDEDFEGGLAEGTNSMNSGTKGSEPSSFADVTYQISNAAQFVLFYRDFVTRKTPYLSVTRVQIKQTALKLLVHVMSHLLERSVLDLSGGTFTGSVQSFSMHFDLHFARLVFQESLEKIPPFSVVGTYEKRYTADSLLSVSNIPIILFLQDLVNLSCACATFTMNDKAILAFQSEAMKLLCSLLEMFSDAIDPDYVDTSGGNVSSCQDNSQNKLMTQYLSQLLGAIRICLTIKHFPELLLSTQRSLFILIQKGFIRDKVAFKRLLKPILAYSEDTFAVIDGKIENSPVSSAQLPNSKILNDVMSIHEHIAFLSSLAGLLLVSNHHDCHPFSNPHHINLLGIQTDVGMKQSIVNAFDHKTVEKIIGACKLVLIDLLRILYEKQKLVTNNLSPIGNIVSSGTSDYHPARGGWLYNSNVKEENILQHLITSSGVLSLSLCFSCNHPLPSQKKGLNIANSINYNRFTDDNFRLLFAYCTVMVAQFQSKYPLYLSSVTLSSLWSNILQLLIVLIDHPYVTNAADSGILVNSWLVLASNISKLPLQLWKWEFNIHFFDFVMKLAKFVSKHATVDDESAINAVHILWKMWNSRSKNVLSLVSGLRRNDDKSVGDSTCLKALESFFVILVIQKQSSGFIGGSLDISHLLKILRLLSIEAIASCSKSDVQVAVELSSKAYEIFCQALNSQSEEFISVECQQLGATTMQALFHMNIQQVEQLQSIFEVMLDAWMKMSTMLRNSVTPPNLDMFFSIILRTKTVMDHPMKSSVLYRSVLQVFAMRMTNTHSSNFQLGQKLLLSLIFTGLRGSSSVTDWEERVLLVRLFLQFYNSLMQNEVGEGNSIIEKFLSISLPVLCESINRYQREEEFCILLGRALTLIARQSGDAFRRLILGLSDAEKQYLQYAMKLAIQQDQNTGGVTSVGTSSGGSNIKSINMDKYRK